ncbi:hypothetical protein [Streptomyces sp. NBC_00872]|uniref:hypothetical protein n=1 Tax=Streptomyces sp. NBC_00872 TaxID=2903686 RepID=UPI003869D1F1|nr:hypothetical protein OG214_18470 [Streptomyces sp. NBC_00872]
MRLRRGKRQKADDQPEADDRPEAPAATPGPAVGLRGVRRQYGRGAGSVHALAGVDLALPRGSFTAVMGPSGSGKFTFPQCAADKQSREGITADHVVTDPAGLPVDAAAHAARAPGVDAAVGLLNTQVLVPVGSGGFTSLQGAATQGVTGSGAGLAKVRDLDIREGGLRRLGKDRIAIDKTLAASADAGVGDRLPLYLPDGTTARPEIVARLAMHRTAVTSAAPRRAPAPPCGRTTPL